MSDEKNAAAGASDNDSNIADLTEWREQHAEDLAEDGDPNGADGGGGPPTRSTPSGPPSEGGPRAISGSDDALALQLAGALAADWRHVAKWGDWLNWDGRRWVRDETLGILTMTRAICRWTANRREFTPGLARGISSAKTVHAVVNLARGDPRIAAGHEEWDADPWLFNTPGGIVDLRTGICGPHDPARRMMQLSGAAPHGEYPVWRQFLHETTGGNQDFADYLQRLAGYSLTGLTQEEIFAFLHGPSGTGKSKFVAALALLHGSYAAAAPMDAFTATRAERHPTDLAGLVGKRLVTAAETEEGRRWDQQRMTALTGRDVISARFMRGDFFSYFPQFLLMFHGNYRPRLNSADAAMRRRLHLIPFRHKPKAVDERLGDKLKAELGGITCWAVEGAVRWARNGLQPPSTITAATAKYFEVENALGAWIDERCERGPELTALTRELYRDYSSWSKAGGEFVLAERRFSETLEMMLGENSDWKHPQNRRRGFYGLALRGRNEELKF